MVNDELLLTVNEAARRLSLGRTFVYELVMRGEIASLKLGRARRVPLQELERFVRERLESDGSAMWQKGDSPPRGDTP